MKFSLAPVLACLAAAPLCAPPAALAQLQPSDDIDSTEYSYPVVITPTRLRQSLGDVPASVTIITGETLRRYGITRIEEALRLVPGMAVTASTGNDYRVNYHGTDAINPRRINVLIDGVSAYRAGLSKVEWVALPLSMEDIDRIEVTRGPDSSSYGPNSMMAVVNILTRHPKDVERGLIVGSVGSHHANGLTARLATRLYDSTDAYVTAEQQRDSGYDNIARPRGTARDSTRVRRVNLRTETDLHQGASLELQAAFVDAQRGNGYVPDIYQTSSSTPDLFQKDAQVSGKWTKAVSPNHEIQIKAYHDQYSAKQNWRTCPLQAALLPGLAQLYSANPRLFLNALNLLLTDDVASATPQEAAVINQALAVTAQLGPFWFSRTTCGNTNQDLADQRTQIELQDTFVFSDSLRMVGGLGLRYQSVDSATYFGGTAGNMVRWAFGHAEYRPTSALTFNLGGYGESDSLGRNTFSPRAAVNYHLSDSQSIRAVYSQGTRTPDLGETRGNWSETVTDLTPPVLGATSGRYFASIQGDPNLSEERITSVELGYLLALGKAGLTLDVRAFDDRLTRLITDYNLSDRLQPTNNGFTRLTGTEAQLNWEMTPRWSSWLSYAYLLNRNPSTEVETLQYSRHSYALGLSHAMTNKWRMSLATFGASGDGYQEKPYARTDVTMSYGFVWNAMPSSATIVMSYLHTPVVATYQGANSFQSSYNDRRSLHGTVRVAF